MEEAFSAGGSDGDANTTSFGYKHGIPLDVDLVFDCRFAEPAPGRGVAPQTGLDEAVADYVLEQPVTVRSWRASNDCWH